MENDNNTPTIQLPAGLQESIAFMQQDGCDMARECAEFIDGLMSVILTDNIIHPVTAEEKVAMLDQMNTIKLHFQAFYAKNR